MSESEKWKKINKSVKERPKVQEYKKIPFMMQCYNLKKYQQTKKVLIGEGISFVLNL